MRRNGVLHTFIPYSADGNLGAAYNHGMSLLHEGDVACFIDHDAMFTTGEWFPQIERILEAHPDFSVFTAVTNRIGNPEQVCREAGKEDHDVANHRLIGRRLQTAHYSDITDITTKKPLSGVVIVVRKGAWDRVKFTDGFLGVDNRFHKDARDAGLKVGLMKGVYVYHWYRAPLPDDCLLRRSTLLNYLARYLGSRSYLEIGVQNSRSTFDHIAVERRIGVDPACHPVKRTNYEIRKLGSDAFFERNTHQFDLVFIDGDHGYDQALRDIEHSAKCLADGGAIVCHDCLPRSEREASPAKVRGPWMGEVYKAIGRFLSRGGWGHVVVDADCGCAILWRDEGAPPLGVPLEMSYADFLQNWRNKLNIVQPGRFLPWLEQHGMRGKEQNGSQGTQV